MKSIKVLYMGKKLCEVYPHATKFQVLKWKVKEFLKGCVRVTFKAGLVGGVGYTIFIAGAYFYNPDVSYAKPIIMAAPQDFPILEKIATCESGGKQFKADGTLMKHVNNDGTVDFGKYEINSIHEAQAVKLGYNIYEEKGNHDMAVWLFMNQGSEPWYSTKSCWKNK